MAVALPFLDAPPGLGLSAESGLLALLTGFPGISGAGILKAEVACDSIFSFISKFLILQTLKIMLSQFTTSHLIDLAFFSNKRISFFFFFFVKYPPSYSLPHVYRSSLLPVLQTLTSDCWNRQKGYAKNTNFLNTDSWAPEVFRVSVWYSSQVFPGGHWWYHLIHHLPYQTLHFVLNFVSHSVLSLE